MYQQQIASAMFFFLVLAFYNLIYLLIELECSDDKTFQLSVCPIDAHRYGLINTIEDEISEWSPNEHFYKRNEKKNTNHLTLLSLKGEQVKCLVRTI